MTKKEKEILEQKLEAFLHAIADLVQEDVLLIYVDNQTKTFKVETTLQSVEHVKTLMTQAYKVMTKEN